MGIRYYSIGMKQQLLWEFSCRFLVGDIDDPTLNQALVEAFFCDFDLCADFKNLYVYPLANEPKLISEIPVLISNGLLIQKEDADKDFLELLRKMITALPKSDNIIVSESELLFPS
jgi:hypothetical protein